MYVSQKRLNRGLEGALRYLATGSAGHRYLLIEIDDAFDLGSSRTGRPAAIAPLAHELQHALEVATADDVRDLESFNTLFPQRRRPNPGGPIVAIQLLPKRESPSSDQLNEGPKFPSTTSSDTSPQVLWT